MTSTSAVIAASKDAAREPRTNEAGEVQWPDGSTTPTCRSTVAKYELLYNKYPNAVRWLGVPCECATRTIGKART